MLRAIFQQKFSCTKNWWRYVIIVSIKIVNEAISKVLFSIFSTSLYFSVVSKTTLFFYCLNLDFMEDSNKKSIDLPFLV